MANLVATISETVTINGALRGSSNTYTVTDITNTFERTVTCPHSNETVIAVFQPNVYTSVGAIDLENTKYIRVTNISTTAVMDLAISGETTSYTVVLTAGASHILCQADTTVLGVASATATFTTLQDIAKITVKPRSTDDANVEIFVGVI